MAMNNCETILRAKNTLQNLMQMGISKQRSEKAVAATGDIGIDEASEWLISHINDPDLDKIRHREYVIYLVPTGQLMHELNIFMQDTVDVCGRNGAHKSFPHITLCQFFNCKDSLMANCVHLIEEKINKKLTEAPKSFKLSPFLTDKYIGLLLEESTGDWLKNVVAEFTTNAVTKLETMIEPHKKQLHLTLAFKFLQEHRDMLEELSKKINIKASAYWELRLYSRDVRLANSEIFRVLYEFSPQKKDELELYTDDYIFLTELDLKKQTSKGWFYGTSFNTGVKGMFPGNYVEYATETECWVLHRSWTVSAQNPEKKIPQYRPTNLRKSYKHYSEVQNADTENALFDRKSELYTKVNKQDKETKPIKSEAIPQPVPKPTGPNRIFIFRHSERVDAIFGAQWIDYSFDKQGDYERKNINMPPSVPKRKPEKFNKDSPITMMGRYQARLSGEAMKDEGVRISIVLTSPSLRCVETAHYILQGLGVENTVKICIEPGLFEWLTWTQGKLPDWLDPDDLLHNNFNINTSYERDLPPDTLDLKERAEEYYKRSYQAMQTIIKRLQPNTAQDTMIIAHAGSLDALSRMITGQLARNAQELTKLTRDVPYVGCCCIEEVTPGNWELTPPPFPTLIHGPNKRFDWRNLTKQHF